MANVQHDSSGDAPTIQAAVDSAGAGDEVVLAAGTYSWTSQGTAGGAEAMVQLKSGVSLRGEAGASGTTLDGERNGRLILCPESGEVRLEGLTITRGVSIASYPFNGGVVCSPADCVLSMVDCVVLDNVALTGG